MSTVSGSNLGAQLLAELISVAAEAGASDIHLKADAKPYLRVKGEIVPCGDRSLPAETTREIILATLSDDARKYLEAHKEVDFAYSIPRLGLRFRVNVYTAQGNWEAVYRLIKEQVAETKDLNLPPVVDKLALAKQGLILVAGSTGQGKSTTLGAMIDKVNKTMRKRIITIENPVELVHKDIKSVISQREVGGDTDSFAVALKSVLRQDPDVILIGEIRDMETAEIALQAAQTGHLVMSTIHAGSAEETIKRFAGLYPLEERPNVKRTLANTIQGVIAQKLVVDVNNNKFPVMEIMVNTHRITQALLADAENTDGEDITAVIYDSELQGMNTLDQYLMKMFIVGRISAEVAFKEAHDPLKLKQDLHRKGYQFR